MSSYLNQIFYCYNKFDTKDSILLLEPFMYSELNVPFHKSSPLKIYKTQSVDAVSQEIQEQRSPINKLQSTFLLVENPKKIKQKVENTFFWSLYVVHYGYEQYIKIGQKYKNAELEERTKMIDFIKTHPHKIKDSNLKITKIRTQEILSDLLSSAFISFFSFPVICLYYHLSVYIVNENTYLYFGVSDTEAKVAMLHYNKKRKHGIFEIDEEENQEELLEKINKIKQENLCLDSYEKPLRGISAYKVDDLMNMARKIGVLDETKKTPKDELYNQIKTKIEKCWYL